MRLFEAIFCVDLLAYIFCFWQQEEARDANFVKNSYGFQLYVYVIGFL